MVTKVWREGVSICVCLCLHLRVCARVRVHVSSCLRFAFTGLDMSRLFKCRVGRPI